MLVTIGDLVDDVVVRVRGSIRPATDTDSTITRRRGGSASNVAAIAARLDGTARFVGQVGDDPLGRTLVAELAAAGVDTASVRHAGSTGTIVVLVDHVGERTMLTDRGACRHLHDPDPTWLADADVLHLPLYSLVGGRLATTALTVAGWAHDRAVPVSLDLSSIALIESLAPEDLIELVAAVRPAVVFANDDEAPALDVLADESTGPLAGVITVRKRGERAAVVTSSAGHRAESRPEPLSRPVDTTGAGDAFAAGFLVATDSEGRRWWRSDPVRAAAAGHAAAADLLRAR